MWSMAKKPTHTFRLQTMSVHDLSNGMVAVRLRLNEAEVKHRGRKLRDGPFLNAVVAWFLSRTEPEQEAIAIEGLRRFEAILEGDPAALTSHFVGLNDPASVPADDVCARRIPGIGIAVKRDRLEQIDSEGQNEAPKPPGKPKRRS